MWGETRIRRSSSAAGRYATESKETKDTGRSANLVLDIRLIKALPCSCPVPRLPPLILRRNRRVTPTRSRLVLLRMSHRRGEETSHRGGALPRVNGPRSIRGSIYNLMVFTADIARTQEAPLEAALLFS